MHLLFDSNIIGDQEGQVTPISIFSEISSALFYPEKFYWTYSPNDFNAIFSSFTVCKGSEH